jgi:hypothetical protein
VWKVSGLAFRLQGSANYSSNALPWASSGGAAVDPPDSGCAEQQGLQDITGSLNDLEVPETAVGMIRDPVGVVIAG